MLLIQEREILKQASWSKQTLLAFPTGGFPRTQKLLPKSRRSARTLVFQKALQSGFRFAITGTGTEPKPIGTSTHRLRSFVSERKGSAYSPWRRCRRDRGSFFRQNSLRGLQIRYRARHS